MRRFGQSVDARKYLFDYLPEELYRTIVTEWLESTNDFIALDSALCNQDVRKRYIPMRKSLFEVTIKNSKKDEKLIWFVDWIDSRNYHVKSLTIKYYGELYSIPWIGFQNIQSLTLECTRENYDADLIGPFVTQTTTNCFTLDSTTVLHSLPNLHSFTMKTAKPISSAGGHMSLSLVKRSIMNTKYFSPIYALKEFRIEGCSFPYGSDSMDLLAAVEWIGRTCPNFTTLTFLDCFFWNATILHTLITKLSHLQHFQCTSNSMYHSKSSVSNNSNHHINNSSHNNNIHRIQHIVPQESLLPSSSSSMGAGLKTLVLEDIVYLDVLIACLYHNNTYRSITKLIVQNSFTIGNTQLLNFTFSNTSSPTSYCSIFEECSQLRQLSFCDCYCTDDIIQQFCTGSNLLEELSLISTEKLTNESMYNIARSFQSLRSLQLCDIPNVTDEAIEVICSELAGTLKGLSIGSLPALTIRAFEAIFSKLTLQSISLDMCAAEEMKNPTDLEMLRLVAEYSNSLRGYLLTQVDFRGTENDEYDFNPNDIGRLNEHVKATAEICWGFPQLKTMKLSMTMLSVQFLYNLARGCPQLSTVSVYDSYITNEFCNVASMNGYIREGEWNRSDFLA
jgi:hypothetical protein